MKLFWIKFLSAMNLVFWPVIKIDIHLLDGGPVALSGFPFPWYRSSVMGTGDLEISLLFLAVNFFLWWFLVSFCVGKFSIAHWGEAKRKTLLVFLVALFAPVFVSFVSLFLLGDWSDFLLFPWEGWNGRIYDVYLSHGLKSANPR
jgi:hypothetical protein